MGAVFDNHIIVRKWNRAFIQREKPSIEYLELYALVAAVVTWSDKLRNFRVAIYCDNKSVCDMVNSTSSGCPCCMNLIRILVTECLKQNCRIFVLYVKSKDNVLADDLSRMKFCQFWGTRTKNNVQTTRPNS